MQVAINGLVSTNNCTKCTFFSLLCRCGATATVGIIKQKHARLVVKTSLATNWAVTILSDSSGGTNMIKTRLAQTKGLSVPRSSAITYSVTGDIQISTPARIGFAFLANKCGLRSRTRWKKNGTVSSLTTHCTYSCGSTVCTVWFSKVEAQLYFNGMLYLLRQYQKFTRDSQWNFRFSLTFQCRARNCVVAD